MRRTSGQRLDPPMPNSRMSSKPRICTSLANFTKASCCASCSSTMSSHPSHFASSSPVHRLASRSHNRFIFPPDCHSAIVDFTLAASDSGREVFILLTVFLSSFLICASFHGGQEFVEGVGEQLHSVFRQLVGDCFHRDAGLGEILHRLLRARDVLGQTLAQLSVV